MPAPQRLLRSPSPSALPAESCSKHRPLSCWASLPLCSPQSRWAPGGRSLPLHRKAKGAFSLHEKQNVGLHLLSGEEETTEPLASIRSESPSAEPESPQVEVLRTLGLKAGTLTSRETPAESVRGSDSSTPQRARQGVLPLPSALGLCCLLTPAPGMHSRPVAFLIIPNQNCIPGAGGIPPAAPFIDHTAEARDGVTCQLRLLLPMLPHFFWSHIFFMDPRCRGLDKRMELGCWHWPAGVSMVENTCVS